MTKKITSCFIVILTFIFAVMPTSNYCASAEDSQSTHPFIIISTGSAAWNTYNAEQTTLDIPRMDVQPVIAEGRMLVPISWFAKVVGFQTSWDPILKGITLAGEKTIKMTIGSKIATVDGNELLLDTSPIIVDGQTMVPLRFIAEAFNYNVYYNPYWGGDYYNGEIYITYYTVLTAEEHYQLRPEPDQKNFIEVRSGNDYLKTYHLKTNGETPKGNRLGDSVAKILSVQGMPSNIKKGSNWEYGQAVIEFVRNIPSDFTGSFFYEDCFNSIGAGDEFSYAYTFTNGSLTEVEVFAP